MVGTPKDQSPSVHVATVWFPGLSKKSTVISSRHALSDRCRAAQKWEARVCGKQVLGPPIDDRLAFYDLDALRVELVATHLGEKGRTLASSPLGIARSIVQRRRLDSDRP